MRTSPPKLLHYNMLQARLGSTRVFSAWLELGIVVAVSVGEEARVRAATSMARLPKFRVERQPVYQKPTVEKFGSFRELTRWGFSSASDGGSIMGVTVSVGCSTTWEGQTYNFGCPTGPTTS